MQFSQINIGETHIRLTSDLAGHNLNKYVFSIRQDLKDYILKDNDFLLSMSPLDMPDVNLSEIVYRMFKSSIICDVGPMACVAGTISEMALDYLIQRGSSYSIVENGGDISIVNDKKVLCGIYSNNRILGNDIAFEIRKRKGPLGICTSSGKIGHSISFGDSDSVTVIGKSTSVCDGLATAIANSVTGQTNEDKVMNALEYCEDYREFFDGVLIICDENVATVGKLPKIVETNEFDIKH
jgi:ApbE superfamily uncharacterized protein (UPF0280 family)